MERTIAHIAVVVRDYDEAIDFYTLRFGFEHMEGTAPGGGRRWVLVTPSTGRGTSTLLARAEGGEQRSRVGNQTGGRVFLFLHTDDFWRDHRLYRSRGIRFVEVLDLRQPARCGTHPPRRLGDPREGSHPTARTTCIATTATRPSPGAVPRARAARA